LHTYLPKNLADKLTSLASGGNPLDPVEAQQFNKLALNGVVEQEKQSGARGGIALTKMLAEGANLNLGLQPGANIGILNTMRVLQRLDLNYMKGRQDWVAQNGAAYAGMQDDYHPLSEFDSHWNKTDWGHVGIASIGALNGTKDWHKGLSDEDALAALHLAVQVDPQARIVDPRSGRLMTFGGGR
jgi:hypothetical protein